MSLLTGICLLVLVVALVGSIAFAAVRGLRTWRTFRRFTRATSAAMDEVMQKGEAAEAKATELTGKSERVSSSIAHLQESLAELTILRAAFANAKSGLTFRMPKK
jgi:hypothetical protein